jgi:hypothetical protein
MEMRINVQNHKVHLLKALLEDLPYVTIESTKGQVLKDLEESSTQVKEKIMETVVLQATQHK